MSSLKLPERLRGGFYCQPTVVTGLADSSRCMQDEIFGPVVCIAPFKGESEVRSSIEGGGYIHHLFRILIHEGVRHV